MRSSLQIIFLFIPFLITAQHSNLYNKGVFYISPKGLLTTKANFINKESGVYTNDGEVLMEGSFNNEGVTGFTPSFDGYTRFQGIRESQVIDGAVRSNFKHVLFDNSTEIEDYSFLLLGDMFISGEANFHRGIIDNSSYGGSMTFDQDGFSFGTSDRSYVNGEVYKLGDNSFIFPIGKERMYRPGGIIQLGELPTSFGAEYHAFNSNNQYSHTLYEYNILEINDQEYWTIEEFTTTGEVMIHLTWDDRITPYRLLRNLEALVILAWDPIALQWISLGGSVAMEENRITSVVEGQGYKVFTLGTIRNLPNDDGLFVHNAINPNDTHGNDYLKVIGLENFPDNRLRIFNRWGVLVFDERAYHANINVFRGVSHGRATIERDKELPVGSYFYILDYVVPSTGKLKSLQGYLYLNR